MQTYNIYRNGELIAENIEDQTYTDNTVEPDTSYTYRVSTVVGNTESDLSEELTVNTLAIQADSLSISPKNTTIEVGKTRQIKVTILPDEASKSVTFETDSDNVSVNENGLIQALSEGTAVVTIKHSDNHELIATTTVTVNATTEDE